MVKSRKKVNYKWMFGVLDPHTHQTIAYKNNMKFEEFESMVSEVRKKL